MTEYLLRIEGMNMGATVFDTHDLSTVRGSSLALLNAVREAATAVKGRTVTPISTGASIGLYSFEVDDDGEAALLRDRVDQWLRSTSPFSHLVFVVDVIQTDSDFNRAREGAIAANRWRQMAAPTVNLPSWNGDSNQVEACAIDHVRVGARRGPQGKPVSVPTLARREYGREAKQSFYTEQAGSIADGMAFVNDFKALTTGAPCEALQGKMALFYADGNRFSSIRDKLCGESDDLRQWDTAIREARRAFLDSLLGMMRKNARRWTTKDGEYQLEVLLWGGDELLVVVPAWNGWETAAHFFDCAATWDFRGTPLSHAAGLVFCHHKAPVEGIRRLAKDLAELAKEHDRTRSLLAYEVLESFDNTSRDLATYREERCPSGVKGISAASLLVNASALPGVNAAMHSIRGYIPRGRLQRAVAEWGKEPAKAKAETMLQPVIDELEQHTAELEALKAAFGTGWPLWAHVLELWDYVGREQ